MEIDNFFGRRSKLELLKKRVMDLKEGYRQNIAFLGSRYIGKSTLLQKFIADIDDSDIVPVYLDIENKDFTYFYLKYVGSLLRAFAKTKNLPQPEDLNLLLEATQSQLPLTVKSARKIQSLAAHNKIDEAYREIISLVEIFASEADKSCVLVIDEFQHLEDWDIAHVFQELGKRIMVQKRCLYILASSCQVTANKILSEKLSLLFGNFETIQVDAFDLKTSQGFVEFNLKSRNLAVGGQLCSFLIDFTGGHPLYLHLICQEFVSLSAIYKQNEIYVPLLTQAIENVLLNPWGVLSRHFELILNRMIAGKNNHLIPAALIVLAQGKKRIRDLAGAVGGSQSVLNQKMNVLMEEDVITKNGNFYYLKDKLFRYWIKYVFQKRIKVIEPNLEKQKQEFHDEINSSIESFTKTSRADLSSRIMDLLFCFDNEALNINGRRYKLPIFDEVVPVKIRNTAGSYFDAIKASAGDESWFIVLKNETISEADVAAIVIESKKLKVRPQRCVLISMNDLDENTRVKALQEKMWIWNEGEINTLLNIYNKPFIV